MSEIRAAASKAMTREEALDRARRALEAADNISHGPTDRQLASAAAIGWMLLADRLPLAPTDVVPT